MGLVTSPVALPKAAARAAGRIRAVQRRRCNAHAPLPKAVSAASSTLIAPVSGPLGAGAEGLSSSSWREGDFDRLLRLECRDEVERSAARERQSSGGPQAVFSVGTSTQTASPSSFALHASNSAVWIPLLRTLHRRRALALADYRAAQRCLLPSVFHDIFPWLWEVEPHAALALVHAPTVRPAPPEGVPGDDAKAALSALRSAAPEQWESIVRRVFCGDDAAGTLGQSTGNGSHSLGYIQHWQEVFFALSVNPALALSASELHTAHRVLLRVVAMYYDACVRAQQDAPLPRSDGTAATFTVTRMPPSIMRRWRKLYRAHYALLSFGELFKRVVEGEESVVAAITAQLRAVTAAESTDAGAGRSPPAQQPLRVSTRLLQDDDGFLFALAIPGGRVNGLSWERQWALTVDYGGFILPRLLQQHALSSTAGGSAGAGVQAVRKAMSVFFNACVWARNDNNEGGRCLEAVRAVLSAHAHSRELPGRSASHSEGTSAGATWAVVRLLRDAAMEAMAGKATKLRLACSPGLFEVATLAVALEMLRPTTMQDNPRANLLDATSDTSLLLARAKSTPLVVWRAAQSHHSVALACRYALLTAGPRLADMLARMAADRLAPPSALRRVRRELCAWADVVGRPLQLSGAQTLPMWRRIVLDRQTSGAASEDERKRTAVAWDLLLADESSAAERAAPWTCGCGFTNAVLAVHGEQPSGGLSCAACVLKTLQPQSWQCPHCLHVASTGERTALCLRCGAAHPSLNATVAEHVRHELSLEQSGACVLPTASTGARTAGPLLFECTDCGSCSLLRRADRRACCSACGGTNGYSRGYFSWDCGCGAANAPMHSHCWACTQQRAEQPASPPAGVCDSDDAGDSTRGFTAAYRCCFCQRDVPVLELSHRRDASARCPHCAHPHPRRVASVARERLVRCPTCHTLTAAAAAACEHCGSCALPALRPLLVSQADRPWTCHHCGCTNDARGGTAARPVEDVCVACSNHRVPPALWEDGRLWSCANCGESANDGVCCHRCGGLSPHIPAAEVHVWRCATCECTLNESWHASCTRPGCGGTQLDASERRLPYSPWRCEACGEVNPTTAERRCAGCGVACAAPCEDSAAGAAAQPYLLSQVIEEEEEEAESEQPSTVEAKRPYRTSASSVGSTPALSSRLEAVERLLLGAAASEDSPDPMTAVSVAPFAPSSPPLVSDSAAPGAAGPSLAAPSHPISASGADSAWEDAYARLAMSL